MRESVFRFKQFAVRNSMAAMKVGTDGVLLGAWCPVEGALRVLDVGTGTGLIALMVAQRNVSAMIDAVDIDHAACDEAGFNVANSPWHERINVECCDFMEYCGCGVGYDLIVSNPPYFDNGLLPPDHGFGSKSANDGASKAGQRCEAHTMGVVGLCNHAP